MVGAITEISTVDYPGLPAMVLFFKGCNLRCAYCHNRLLAREPDMVENIDYDEVQKRISAQSKVIQAVVFSGGEPCYSASMESAAPPELSIYGTMTTTRNLGLKMKIDTNGTYPEELENMILAFGVNYVALDIKTYPILSLRYAPYRRRDWTAILASLNILEEARTQYASFGYEIRTTCYPPSVPRNAVSAIARLIPAEVPYFLQRYRPARERGPEPYSDTSMQCLLSAAREYHKNTTIRGDQDAST
jgi:anaerobic ribonucleoside-triphosphate reductase activating protein